MILRVVTATLATASDCGGSDAQASYPGRKGPVHACAGVPQKKKWDFTRPSALYNSTYTDDLAQLTMKTRPAATPPMSSIQTWPSLRTPMTTLTFTDVQPASESKTSLNNGHLHPFCRSKEISLGLLGFSLEGGGSGWLARQYRDGVNDSHYQNHIHHR